MLIAVTEAQLLYTVVAVYLTLAGLWFVYWVVERMRDVRGRYLAYSQYDEGYYADEPGFGATPASVYMPHADAPVDAGASPDEIEALREQLKSVQEQSKVTESRLQTLQTEFEALKLSLAEKLVAPVAQPQPEPETPEECPQPALSIFCPELEGYDADWASLDPDFGVVLAKRPDDADDLTRIWGVGDVNQKCLNENGIYCFRQIAEWSQHNIDKFNELLCFKGRIEREDWIGQAQRLLDGDQQSRAA